MATQRQILAFHAIMSIHGRADNGRKIGFVMGTVKDANDSDTFKPIGSGEFIKEQSMYILWGA